MDLLTAKYIMDYIYYNRANETAFQYYRKVSFCIVRLKVLVRFMVNFYSILHLGSWTH